MTVGHFFLDIMKKKKNTIRIVKRILFWLTIIFIFVSAGFYVYMRTNGRALLEQKLTEVFGRDFRVKSINFFFPFTLSMNQVQLSQDFQAKGIKINLSWPFFYGNQIIVSRLRLVEPLLKITRDQTSPATTPDPSAKQTPSTPISEKVSKYPFQRFIRNKKFFVNTIQVYKGLFTLTDRAAVKPITYEFQDLSMRFFDVAYPWGSQNIEFDIKGKFISDGSLFSGGTFNGKGWANFIEKSMDAEVNGKNKEAGLSFSAQVKSLKNNLTAGGRLHVDKPAKAIVPDKVMDYSSDDLFLTAIQALNLKADVGFSFQTQMDNFRIEQVSLSGQIGYEEPAQGIQSEGEQIPKKSQEGKTPDPISMVPKL